MAVAEDIELPSGAVVHRLDGMCPVQAEFTLDGQEFYFRARGQHWQVYSHDADDVGDLLLDEKWCEDEFGAGYMSDAEALGLIEWFTKEWRSGAAPGCRSCDGTTRVRRQGVRVAIGVCCGDDLGERLLADEDAAAGVDWTKPTTARQLAERYGFEPCTDEEWLRRVDEWQDSPGRLDD